MKLSFCIDIAVAGLYRPWIHTHTELNDLSRTEEN